MPEAESLQTMLHGSFQSVGGGNYALRSGLSLSSGTRLPVEPFPFKSNSLSDSRAVLEPVGSTILAGFTSAEIVPGYYEIKVIWGNKLIAGGGEPTLADIINFGSYANAVKIDDLVAVGGIGSQISGYFNLGGFDFSIRTNGSGSPNVVYMALIVATRISDSVPV